jgi:hypothetical protein
MRAFFFQGKGARYPTHLGSWLLRANAVPLRCYLRTRFQLLALAHASV